MGTEWPVISEGFQTVSKVLISRKRSNQILFLVIFLVMLCLVPLMVVAGLAAGLNLLLALVGIIIVIALLVRGQWLDFVVLLCTLLVDQNPLPLLGNGPNIYVFYWPTSLQGLPDRPSVFNCY